MSVCYLTSFGTSFPGIKAALLGLVTSAFRFAFVFRYKSIPPMNNDILVAIVHRSVVVWSFFACTFKLYFEPKTATDIVSAFPNVYYMVWNK